jgi:hypothetical protein
MDQPKNIGPGVSSGHLLPITGLSPAAIKRQTEAGDGFAADQGFEPQQRCHGPNLIHLIDQGDWIMIGRYDIAPLARL